MLRTLIKAETESYDPILKSSTLCIVNEKANEDRSNAMKYKSELDEVLKRNIIYESDVFKAYALLWEHCAKVMKSKLIPQSDYNSEMYNNPIR